MKWYRIKFYFMTLKNDIILAAKDFKIRRLKTELELMYIYRNKGEELAQYDKDRLQAVHHIEEATPNSDIKWRRHVVDNFETEAQKNWREMHEKWIKEADQEEAANERH